MRKNRHITPWDIRCLTPTKLATFYRLVGGDYDQLFSKPSKSLSFIYQSLGCYHTLQPEKDPFSPPTVPALTPQGFVRWQTVQLLLEPEEHVPFLQEAVKRFEITNPSDGDPFPNFLPREALPSKPDMEMLEWYESNSDRLRLEAQASQAHNLPIALSDGEAESSIASSVDDRSVIDVGNYSSTIRSHSSIRLPKHHVPPLAVPSHALHYQSPQDSPWSPLNQRNAVPPGDFPQKLYNQPGGSATPTSSERHHYFRRHHPRSPSSVSTVSSSSGSSSPSTSTASLSPALRPKDIQRFPPLERRHSASFPYDPRNSTSRPSNYHQAPPRPQTSYLPSQHPPYPPPPGSPPPGPQRSKAKGLNVRWRGVDDVFQLPSSPGGTLNENPRPHLVESYLPQERARSGEIRSGGKTNKQRIVSPVRGVSGRRYATEGVSWR